MRESSSFDTRTRSRSVKRRSLRGVVTVVPWGERTRLATLPADAVVVVAEPDRCWLAAPELLDAVAAGGTLAAADGSAVVGRAGAVGALCGTAARDAVAGPTDVVRAWEAGADLDLDHDGEVFAPAGTVAVVGETVLDRDARIVPIVIGDAPEVAARRARLDANRAAVDRLLDLDRVAAGARTAITVVAAEILALPLWAPAFCAALIDTVESWAAWSSDPVDPVPGVEISLGHSPRLFAAVAADVASLVVPRLRTEWPEFAWCGLHDVFVIRYDAIEATPALALHHDVAQISGSVRLNAGYDGGALEFPRQDYDNGALVVGESIWWPSLVTHPHRGAPVDAGRKYGLTVWCALPE